MSAPLCFIDTETTGVHPDRKVWEIGMVRLVGDERTDTSFFVQVDLDEADPRGLAVGRFYQRHPLGITLSEGGPAPLPDDDGSYVTTEEAAHRVARWTHGAHLVGAVPSFDAEVLDDLPRYWSLIPAWHYHVIDVEALAIGYLHGLDSRPVEDGRFDLGTLMDLPWKSDAVSRALGVEPPSDEFRHTALGDAYWAMTLYYAVTRGAAK